ncbi:hypothetical protein JZU48_00365 [bacterium]|nr:hypothetical protein [bacterium]
MASHECGLIAVEKPDGILSHPNPGEVAEKGTILITGNYSLDEEAFHVRDGKGGIRRVYLLNRLDSPTSGTLLLSLDEGVADLVRKMFARSQVMKRYVALIRGRGLRTPRGTWQDQMAKTKGPGGGVRSPFRSSSSTRAPVARISCASRAPRTVIPSLAIALTETSNSTRPSALLVALSVSSCTPSRRSCLSTGRVRRLTSRRRRRCRRNSRKL